MEEQNKGNNSFSTISNDRNKLASNFICHVHFMTIILLQLSTIQQYCPGMKLDALWSNLTKYFCL